MMSMTYSKRAENYK